MRHHWPRIRRLMVVSLVLFVAGQASILRAQRTTSASTPVEAVKQMLSGFSSEYTLYSPCKLYTPAEGCAITARLQHRLHVLGNFAQKHHGVCLGCALSIYEIVCVCGSGGSGHNTFRLQSLSNRRAVVNVVLKFSSGSNKTSFIVVHHSAQWRVNDRYCTGHPETSLYLVRPSSDAEYGLSTCNTHL